MTENSVYNGIEKVRGRLELLIHRYIPLFQQRAVHLKMAKFHEGLGSLQTSRCSTCFKNFPGLKMKSSSSECVHCHLDHHIPKLYSSNNMHPGV